MAHPMPILVAALLSGCGSSDGTPPDGNSLPRDPARVSFAAATKVSMGVANSSQGEAELAVNGAGVVVAGWTDRRLNGSGGADVRVYLTDANSIDGPYAAPQLTTGRADVEVRTDASDRFHLVVLSATGIEYLRLHPNAMVDTQAVIAASGGLDRPWIALHGDQIAIVWSKLVSSGSTLTGIRTMISTSVDGGNAFSTPREIPLTDPFVAPSGVVWADDKTLYVGVMALEFSGVPGGSTLERARASVMRSDDAGATIAQTTELPTHVNVRTDSGIDPSQPDRSALNVNFPLLGVLSNGRVIAAWTSPSGTDLDIVCSGSSDRGVTFESPVTINDDVGAAFHVLPGLTVDAADRAHFVWMDGRDTNPSDKPPGHVISGGSYRAMYAISRDGCRTASANVPLRTQGTALQTKGDSRPTLDYINSWVGDLFSVSARGSNVFPVWSDTTSGRAEAYVVRGEIEP